MGACFHIAGVYCENCDPLRSRVIGDGGVGTYLPISIGAPLTGDLAGSYPPPLATAASLDALRAEVAALKKELRELADRIEKGEK